LNQQDIRLRFRDPFLNSWQTSLQRVHVPRNNMHI
jgi:hypothetical protein